MLRFVDQFSDGITRRQLKRGWAYHRADGSRITERDEIDRLNAVGLPPAYVDAWFCADPAGHIQAVGFDAKGRKQYRYHPDFRAEREAEKYATLAAFGRALPALRKRVRKDPARAGSAATRSSRRSSACSTWAVCGSATNATPPRTRAMARRRFAPAMPK
jgi:DNA topoisomerase I